VIDRFFCIFVNVVTLNALSSSPMFHVTEVLHLGSNTISGTLPSEIGKLTKLGGSDQVGINLFA